MKDFRQFLFWLSILFLVVGFTLGIVGEIHDNSLQADMTYICFLLNSCLCLLFYIALKENE